MIEGRVTEVTGDEFAALVTLDDEPEVLAIFSLSDWPDVRPGDVFKVEGDRIVPIVFPPLSEEEWRDLRERAHAKYEELRRYLD